jgi:hypothetical protein
MLLLEGLILAIANERAESAIQVPQLAGRTIGERQAQKWKVPHATQTGSPAMMP